METENTNNLNTLTKKELINTISSLKEKVSQLEADVEKYKFYAFCDVMTTSECNTDSETKIKIYNRTYWDALYREEHANCECDFYLVDLNNLKTINDTKGHQHGDKHICNCVKLLASFGTVFRLGGDEFILIPPKEKEEELKQYLKTKGYNLDFAYGYKHKMPTDTFYQVLKYTDNEMYKFKNKQKEIKNR